MTSPARYPVAVVMRREAITGPMSRWQTHRWVLHDVLADGCIDLVRRGRVDFALAPAPGQDADLFVDGLEAVDRFAGRLGPRLLQDPLALGVDPLRGPDLLGDRDPELVDQVERRRLIDDDVAGQREPLAVGDQGFQPLDEEDDVDRTCPPSAANGRARRRRRTRGLSHPGPPVRHRSPSSRGRHRAARSRSAAAAAGGTPRVQELLVRAVDTVTQTAFDRERRRENLKNAFALAKGAPLNPAQHYVLVDDVFTTGSTLNGCARVLRRAGCLNLDVVTFGHG